MSTQGITGRIARQEWLKPVEENLQKAVHKAFESGGERGQQAKDFLQGKWMGHPLHVILTDLPIGAWTVAMIFDLVEAASGRDEFATAADTSIAVGVAGALGAAVAGITDWQDIDPPARRIGLVHAALNVGGVGLFATSLVMRKRGSRGLGRLFSVLGYAVATVAARLGGNLVYEQRIGIDHTAGLELPEDFVGVMRETELPESTPRRAVHNGVPILLIRQGEHIFALVETCSHLGGPLSEGKLQDGTIQCPWHGSRFAIDTGNVVNGPAVHPQPCLEARVRNGQIEVRKFTRTEPIPLAGPSKLVEQESRTGTRG